MSENVTEVGDETFEAEVLGSDVTVLVDFWADWCVPCHMVSPVVEEIAREQAGKLKVHKLNVDDNPAVTQKFAVMSIPSLIVFSGGQEVARVIGAKGKEQILKELEPHLSA